MRRRLLAVSVMAIMLSLLAPAAFAVQTRATADDVIKMYQANMSGADIVAFIEREGVYAALSQEDIARLEEAGLPARLIVAVDRTFTEMAADDRQRADSRTRVRQPRARRPVVYGSPYYDPFYRPYYSPWHADIGFSFGHGGFGHGGRHGGFGGHRGHH
ncbi:MAG TPA: hypothetical protein VJZ00_11150 [Thermoanaerobaculia bacterium]|nr:hypothetical protein [Thermoanaerobaculia bacterium]